MQSEQLVKKLNVKNRFLRQLILTCLKKRENSDSSLKPIDRSGANLNVHTYYSFSPYSPAFAAYMAYRSGIKIAGICDFGTVSGSKEFEKSCKILGLSNVSGFEISARSEVLGNFSVCLYGVNKNNQEIFSSYLSDFSELLKKRAESAAGLVRNRLEKFDMSLSFEEDVLPLIDLKNGGVVTLKHVYMAEAQKIIEKYGKGKSTADFLRNDLCLDIAEGEYNLLCDANDPCYLYDLLSTLKNNSKLSLKEEDYPLAAQITAMAHDSGVIAVYEYECKYGWLELETESEKAISEFSALLDKIKGEGFNAVGLRSREYGKNALSLFVKAIKEKNMLVVLNDKTEYPRSLFKPNPPDDAKQYIETCAYAVLGNAMSICECLSDGMFSDKTLIKCPSFEERLGVFSAIGKKNQ